MIYVQVQIGQRITPTTKELKHPKSCYSKSKENKSNVPLKSARPQLKLGFISQIIINEMQGFFPTVISQENY